MANQEQRERLLASSQEDNESKAWNQWRKQHPDVHIDLMGADLRNGYLYGVDLRGADLREVDLSEAILKEAVLREADLRSACLIRADLTRADLRYACLTRANLMRASLSRAALEGANMQACQMAGARFDTSVSGEPLWPEIAASAWDALQEEARSPTTSADRLVDLATSWPGYRVRHLLAANPNLPQDWVIILASRFPGAFLTNPMLPWWFVAEPNWLSPEVARHVLEQVRQEPNWQAVAQQYADLVVQLERRAADGSGPW